MREYRMGNVSPTRPRKSADLDVVTTLQHALSGLAEVRSYTAARAPILSPGIRAVVHQWLTELRSEEELKAVGTKARKKMLLSGPPGCGKTTLAHHLAFRLGIPLVIVGPENLVDKYLGGTTAAIANLFKALTEADQRCVMLMDEIDALGASRDSLGNSSASSEMKNAMTVMLRKFEEYDGLVIAATNRPAAIDKALWRRFELQLTVDLPQHDERWAILKLYSQPFIVADEVIDTLTYLTNGASPALLEGIMLGMKRALIVNPRMNQPIDDPQAVFRTIVSALHPPPEIAAKMPALWTADGISDLADLRPHWPPTLPASDPDPSPPPG